MWECTQKSELAPRPETEPAIQILNQGATSGPSITNDRPAYERRIGSKRPIKKRFRPISTQITFRPGANGRGPNLSIFAFESMWSAFPSSATKLFRVTARFEQLFFALFDRKTMFIDRGK